MINALLWCSFQRTCIILLCADTSRLASRWNSWMMMMMILSSCLLP